MITCCVKLHNSPKEAPRRRVAVLASVEAAGKLRQMASERPRLIGELSSSRETVQQERLVRPPLRLFSRSWDDPDFEHFAEQLESSVFSAKKVCALRDRATAPPHQMSSTLLAALDRQSL